MVQRQVKPINEGARRPPKGRLTYAAIGGIILLIVLLLMAVFRPVLDRRDGAEGTASVEAPVASGFEAAQG